MIEIGCGNGDTAVAAGRAVGDEGSVLGVDLSEDMLAVARSRVAAAGLTTAIWPEPYRLVPMVQLTEQALA